MGKANIGTSSCFSVIKMHMHQSHKIPVKKDEKWKTRKHHISSIYLVLYFTCLKQLHCKLHVIGILFTLLAKFLPHLHFKCLVFHKNLLLITDPGNCASVTRNFMIKSALILAMLLI